jgi:hypothetical protein
LVGKKVVELLPGGRVGLAIERCRGQRPRARRSDAFYVVGRVEKEKNGSCEN